MLLSEPQILAGAEFAAGVLGTVAGGRGCWNEMSRWKQQKLRVRVCVCMCARARVCWGKGMVTVGDKGLSAAREPMRGRITSGMGRSARTARNLYGLLRPLMERSPSLASGVYSGILQQQPTGPLALWESPRIYSLHSIQVSPRHSLL